MTLRTRALPGVCPREGYIFHLACFYAKVERQHRCETDNLVESHVCKHFKLSVIPDITKCDRAC